MQMDGKLGRRGRGSPRGETGASSWRCCLWALRVWGGRSRGQECTGLLGLGGWGTWAGDSSFGEHSGDFKA